MGDDESTVAQPSAMDYTSVGYASNDYSGANSEGNAYTKTTGMTGGTTSTVDSLDAVVADGSNSGDEHAQKMQTNSVSQECRQDTKYETKLAGEAIDSGEKHVGQEASGEVSAHAVGYDTAYGNGVGHASNVTVMANAENGNVSNDAGGSVGEQHLDEGSVSSEEERLWNTVRVNCLDFNSWTALIQETEKVAEDNIVKIQKVYDAFLAEFPLCYGYWKKYADHEARVGSADKIVEVYERAVQAVTYSVDIWLHYCTFAISTYGDPETVRRLFERGLAYVGTDYLSYPLWDKYIEYEFTLQEWSRLAMIYTRILENPIQQLDRYFSSFKELAGSRPLSELQTVEEASITASSSASGDQGVEGEVHPDGVEESHKPVSAASTEAEELEKYVAVREEMYKKAKEFDSKIIHFETAIRRPYFHVKPLDDAQLENWHRYLDFIEGEDDFNKVIKLYERCLIACANYPEYWIRYVLCMEARGSMELANNAIARATQVFVKRQPEIHLFAARFKEQSGDVSEARAEYRLVYSELSPGLLEAIFKHANMEYRLGNTEAAFSVYEEAIAAERRKEQSQILPMLFVQYSRFLYLVAGNVEKAQEVLDGAVEHVQLLRTILEAIIYFESISPLPKRIDYLDSLVEKFITPNSENPTLASAGEREELSSIYLEFLDLFGDSQTIKKADNRHAKLFLHQKSLSESKKRHAEDSLTSDKTKVARSYSSASSQTPSVMGAYPSSQSQWPAGYGSQPQAWPPATTQTQGQQWNPGYSQQAGYSGYSAYGSYTQMPTTAPQTAATAAYGAYSSAYPPLQQAAAYPQQNFAQATATPAFTAAQQVATVPQTYYSGYY